MDVRLRPVRAEDLDAYFEHQSDAEAARIADVPVRDRAAFDAHWARVLADPACRSRTILADGAVAGNVGSFVLDGERLVGYRIAREAWGRGIATRALRLFLEEEPRRPLRAHVARGNAASIRVLEKCGFAPAGEGPEGLLAYELAGPGDAPT